MNLVLVAALCALIVVGFLLFFFVAGMMSKGT